MLLRDVQPLLDMAWNTSSACNVSSWVGEACAGRPWALIGCSGPGNTGFVTSFNATIPCLNEIPSGSSYELPASLADLTGLTRCAERHFCPSRSTPELHHSKVYAAAAVLMQAD